jgi:hypothetical protein
MAWKWDIESSFGEVGSTGEGSDLINLLCRKAVNASWDFDTKSDVKD